MSNKFLSLIAYLLLCFSIYAEDRAIIVFDASGSMWGQLEGKTKIAIAKETLGNVVQNWDEKKQLGLLAYGHRRKGDCKDIETLVPVGKINKTGMVAKVNKINPKGKTPISASIRMAADELKFTEDNATVILISDGKETCNADPCGTAAELEKLGVNFTAHVIGFGVDKQTSEQLKCIAANTGGLYFPADNADQLNNALQQVVEKPRLITIRAVDNETGSILQRTIDWKLINQDTEEVISLRGSGTGVTIELKAADKEPTADKTITAGKWLVSGSSGNVTSEINATITTDEDQLIKVNMLKQLPKVVINAATEAITGTKLDIGWEAPADIEGKINFQMADEKPKYDSNPYFYTKNKNKKEGYLRLPAVVGDYVLRYYDIRDRKTVLAEHPITLKPAEIIINAPNETGIGTEIDISWTAPKTADAKINLQLAAEKSNYSNIPYLYTRDKKEGVLRMPAVAGDYLLRWYNISDRIILAERPIKLVQEQITINAPAEAITGTEIDLSWEAPKTADARINLQMADEKPKYNNSPYLYTKNKKEGLLRMPSVVGDYMLRWYNISDRIVLAERPIKLVETKINITAPDEAGAGTEIDISWQAPKTADARINLQLADEKPRFDTPNYLYTKNKTKATMRLPSVEGDYILRWYNLSDRKIITERPIKLTAQQISINAPDEATAGTEVEISWDAPKGLDSFINIQLADEKPNYNARNYIYTKKKQSEYMRMPTAAGDYMLRWWNKKDHKALAEKSITLKPAEIAVTAPETAIAGTEVEITWQAPKGLDSFINIQMADEKPNYNASHYIYTKKKSAEWMRLPSEAGDYILRWWNKGARDKPLSETAITLTKPDIKIIAPKNGIEGSDIEISWEAPKGLDSFINIQAADERPNYNVKHYLYTKRQNSGYLKLPNKAGDYKLRWWNKGARSKPIHEQDFTIITGE